MLEYGQGLEWSFSAGMPCVLMRHSVDSLHKDEFESLIRHLKRDGIAPPRKSSLVKKHQQILTYSRQKMTEVCAVTVFDHAQAT